MAKSCLKLSRISLVWLCVFLFPFIKSETTQKFNPEFIPIYLDKNNQIHFSNQSDSAENFFNATTDTKFLLYTRRNPTAGQEVILNNRGSLIRSPFNPRDPVRYVIHGWLNDGDSPVNQLIRDAFLLRDDYNVFIVDWCSGACTADYVMASLRVPSLGQVLAEFIAFVRREGGILPEEYLIGHSLGAHAAGIAGKKLKNVAAIFGLDPAAPGFSYDDVSGRLSIDDAEFVEVMHTDAGFFGFVQPLGHVDMYPNGGRDQPGCGIVFTCSHSRAYEIFAESINSKVGFYGIFCNSHLDAMREDCRARSALVQLGNDRIDKLYGIFHLKTGSEPPYALGKGLEVGIDGMILGFCFRAMYELLPSP